MAWRCSAPSNAALVDNLCRSGLIRDAAARDAFLAVDRADYAPARPYDDCPQLIGHGATISAPHMHAAAVEHLLPRLRAAAADVRVLDVGSGSGYLTHLLAELAGPRALVVGLEHVPALRALGEANMRKSVTGAALLNSGRVRFRVGDGRRGHPGDGGAWDVIHVGAAAREVHTPLLAQLRAPGCLFIPVGDDWGDQHVWRIDKDVEGRVERTRLFGVRYVALTDPPE